METFIQHLQLASDSTTGIAILFPGISVLGSTALKDVNRHKILVPHAGTRL